MEVRVMACVLNVKDTALFYADILTTMVHRSVALLRCIPTYIDCPSLGYPRREHKEQHLAPTSMKTTLGC